MTGVIIAVAIVVFIVFALLFFLFKRKGNPAEGGQYFIEVEKSQQCSDSVKRELLKDWQKLNAEAEKIYTEIQNILKSKELPTELSREYQNFLRIYNVIREMEHEIELYPAPNCREYFGEKIRFYARLIRDFHSKMEHFSKGNN